MSPIILLIVVVVAAVAAGAGYFIGYNNRKKTAEAQIGSAEAEATRLVNEAIKTADQKRKEAVLEAKDEAFRLKAEVDAQKAEADKEIKQRRAEISRQENRIDQKENALDRKTEALEKKEEELKKKHEEADSRLAEVDAIRAKEMERLETLAGLSQEDAREVLLHKVDEELTHEKAVRVAAYETDLKENCDNIARNMIGQAISRCAADHCSETTVSVVPLPSDEMKGRIIGREGRNIRALETATGVDLIIDDTPEAITLSSFDQTRREVARMTLERLIGDGRIHPARIEETVEKCRHDLELQMKREGERAVMELGIHGLHPDLIKLIGRLLHQRAVESAGGGQARIPLACRLPGGFGALDGGQLSRNDDLARAIEVRRDEHLTLRALLAQLLDRFPIGFKQRAHHARSLGSGLRHKAGALGHERKRFLVGEHARNRQGANLPQRESEHGLRLRTARLQGRGDTHGQRAGGRLRIPRVVELLGGSAGHKLGHVIAEHIGSAIEHRLDLGNAKQALAHAGLLGALAREHEYRVHTDPPTSAPRWHRLPAGDCARRRPAPAPSAHR